MRCGAGQTLLCRRFRGAGRGDVVAWVEVGGRSHRRLRAEVRRRTGFAAGPAGRDVKIVVRTIRVHAGGVALVACRVHAHARAGVGRTEARVVRVALRRAVRGRVAPRVDGVALRVRVRNGRARRAHAPALHLPASRARAAVRVHAAFAHVRNAHPGIRCAVVLEEMAAVGRTLRRGRPPAQARLRGPPVKRRGGRDAGRSRVCELVLLEPGEQVRRPDPPAHFREAVTLHDLRAGEVARQLVAVRHEVSSAVAPGDPDLLPVSVLQPPVHVVVVAGARDPVAGRQKLHAAGRAEHGERVAGERRQRVEALRIRTPGVEHDAGQVRARGLAVPRFLGVRKPLGAVVQHPKHAAFVRVVGPVLVLRRQGPRGQRLVQVAEAELPPVAVRRAARVLGAGAEKVQVHGLLARGTDACIRDKGTALLVPPVEVLDRDRGAGVVRLEPARVLSESEGHRGNKRVVVGATGRDEHLRIENSLLPVISVRGTAGGRRVLEGHPC
mmetsp:Transcript_26238/g.66087  ORF Transcript_26238/g.66087 Transcript_26238/m.66087 type:complete len:497 (-) Transcript_26238:1766-3256(-)